MLTGATGAPGAVFDFLLMELLQIPGAGMEARSILVQV